VAHVLLVEDDPIFQEMLKSVLEQYSHTVAEARTAAEAVAQAKGQNFDLLLSDVRIAGAEDGVESLRQIRKLQPDIRCILMTGYADAEVPLRAAGLCANDYLLKPFKIQTLLQSVRSVLGGPQHSPSFLRRISAVPGQAAQKALRWFYDKQLQQLEELRQQGVSQFFLLVRSKRLKAQDAQAFFAALEEIELEYLKNDSPQRWADLIRAYHAWGKNLVLMQVPEKTSPSISTQAFELIYARIQSGLIESHQLLKAIELWHFPEARKRSLQDFCNFQWLWGETIDQGDPFMGLNISGYRLVHLLTGANSAARLYEAESEFSPQDGDRILCLPSSQEWAPLLRRELAAEQARHLCTAHGHDFLLYPSYATSLRARLPGNGMSSYEAWRLLRPVFLQVAGHHGRGQVSGCFSLRDIDWPPGQECSLSRFSDSAYTAAHIQLQTSQGPVSEFYSAPEVLHQPVPTAASDQAVLGRILFETIYGGRYPDPNLRVAIRSLGEPQSNLAFAPYLERLKPIQQIFYRLAHADPAERFPDLRSAITALDEAF